MAPGRRHSLAPLARGHRRHRPDAGRPAAADPRAETPSDAVPDTPATSHPAPPPPWCWPTAPCSGAAASAPTPRPPAPVGEVCFNTGMTGYQETLTDPSYAGQIITFTFPHIGNVGTNAEDIEAATIAARGLVVKQDVTEPSNWRAAQHLDAWLRARGIAGIAGVDTRALTVRIRDGGAPNGRAGVSAGRPLRPGGAAGAGGGMAGAGGHGPREGGLLPADLRLGRDALGLARRLRPADRAEAPRRGGGLRGEAQHPALPGLRRVPGDRGAGDRLGRGHPAPRARTACSCRTAPAIRRRPANTRCRRSAACWTRACRCSASAWATSCWRWRWARRPTRWSAAIAAPTSR